ncbi:hypothetical protein SAMN05192550_0179 [Flavobacterium glycines]|uniref:Lipoprotein n=1 Tax=Flavobacterium glycines TaxID=551990 RepID=A0A1B9DPT8_9FLAO|nr:hypothetical protein [Flavobacterium glycines]OCB71719.1 hypothetical protein FBGL_10925 [Flavobacterium glycines]GEL10770.1 hypothetical protein FGL01_15090 [Flavobacterium glycines]SDI55048.1 hypothetical protein SAMN05192550_0179 [Flavobacterium glycines]
MKTEITFIALILVLISCVKKDEVKSFPYESFVFSYAGLHHNNSIKFTKTDTVYLQKRFPSPVEIFYAILKKEDKNELNKYLSQFDFEKFDTVYVQDNLQDGESYLLNISKKDENKMIYIYGHNAPKKLYNFIDSLGSFKAKLKFIPVKRYVDFGNLKSILPPPPPPPEIDTLIYKSNIYSK